MFCCYYRHSDKHYKKSTHGVAIPRDEFLYQGSSSIVSIVKAEIFLRYFFVQFIQSRVFVSVAYFRQLIQPDLESRFIVRSHLGPSIQSGFSLSARLHDPPTYRRTVTPHPPPNRYRAHIIPKLGFQSSWIMESSWIILYGKYLFKDIDGTRILSIQRHSCVTLIISGKAKHNN